MPKLFYINKGGLRIKVPEKQKTAGFSAVDFFYMLIVLF